MENKRLGWDDISETFDKIYPNKEPKHYGTIIKYDVGGNDPLDGISVYDAGDYYHFVTYGFSEIYEKENDSEISGFGFELTYKLKKTEKINENEIMCFLEKLQMIARYVFETKNVFKANQYIYTGQINGIDLNHESNIVGFVTIKDTLAGKINSVNGSIEFIQLVGATLDELNQIINKVKTKEEVISNILERYGDITDLERGNYTDIDMKKSLSEKKNFTIIKTLNQIDKNEESYTIIFNRDHVHMGDYFHPRTIKVSGNITIKDILNSNHNSLFIDIYGEEFYLKGLLPLEHWNWYIFINNSDTKIATIDKNGNIFLECEDKRICDLAKENMQIEIFANTREHPLNSF